MPASFHGPVLVCGASGALGLAIVQRLRLEGAPVIAAYRTDWPEATALLRAAGAECIKLQLSEKQRLKALLSRCEAAIFTPLLTVSCDAASLLRDGQPAVFFSSNNVAIDHEAMIYGKLRTAEAMVREAAPQSVLLRPTMIYGHRGDRNISRLMAAMKRYPLVPIVGARAMQQPVYFKDLAAIAVAALNDPGIAGKTIAAAGPAPMRLSEVYATIRRATRAHTVFLPVPIAAAVIAAALATRIGLELPISPVQLRRAGMDKIPIGQVILGETPLDAGLQALAANLAGKR